MLNHYKCTNCGYDWYDEWDCACDDECPQCGTIMTTIDEADIPTNLTESVVDNILKEY